MTTHERYISRCFELARHGSGLTRSNPLVGAVLVHNGEIIGEGWHQKYGGPHAEVNAINSVPPQDRHRIPEATLYCNLEPCFHFGKTPPCVDLVIQNQIKTLVISNTDPNPLVAGKSIERVRGLGVHVLTDVLKEEGEWLNRVFLKHIHTQQPYIILKWAESADGFISKTGEQTTISSPATNRLAHTWRSETGAILVGTHTAITDNPELNNRFYPTRPSPLRIALDLNKKISGTHHLLSDSLPTLILGETRSDKAYSQTTFLNTTSASWLQDMLDHLKQAGITSLLVEGGANTHQQFIDGGMFDEIRRIRNTGLFLKTGIRSAALPHSQTRLKKQFMLGVDHVEYFLKEAYDQ